MPERILCLLQFPDNSPRFSELESGGSLSIDVLPGGKELRSCSLRRDLASDKRNFSEASARLNADTGGRVVREHLCAPLQANLRAFRETSGTEPPSVSPHYSANKTNPKWRPRVPHVCALSIFGGSTQSPLYRYGPMPGKRFFPGVGSVNRCQLLTTYPSPASELTVLCRQRNGANHMVWQATTPSHLNYALPGYICAGSRGPDARSCSDRYSISASRVMTTCAMGSRRCCRA
jgi:hypothetical protein